MSGRPSRALPTARGFGHICGKCPSPGTMPPRTSTTRTAPRCCWAPDRALHHHQAQRTGDARGPELLHDPGRARDELRPPDGVPRVGRDVDVRAGGARRAQAVGQAAQRRVRPRRVPGALEGGGDADLGGRADPRCAPARDHRRGAVRRRPVPPPRSSAGCEAPATLRRSDSCCDVRGPDRCIVTVCGLTAKRPNADPGNRDARPAGGCSPRLHCRPRPENSNEAPTSTPSSSR